MRNEKIQILDVKKQNRVAGVLFPALEKRGRVRFKAVLVARAVVILFLLMAVSIVPPAFAASNGRPAPLQTRTLTPTPIGYLQAHHVAISVPDLESTVRWYQDKLGFQLVAKYENPEIQSRFAHLERNGFRIEVCERKNSRASQDAYPDPAKDLLIHGLKHIAFTVDDLDAFSSELKRRGVEFVLEPTVDPPTVRDALNWKYCFIKDNNGNLIELAQKLDQKMTSDAKSFDQTFTHHMANVNGARLHYVIGGKGEPVVLLHGWPTTWYEWKRIMPALASRYTVIVPDTPGLGDSSRPVTSYDKQTLAEYIYGLVQQLGYKQINLIGHDLGGQIAYAYASAYPENVRRLAILDVPIPGLAGWDELPDNLFWHFVFHSVPDVPEALVAGRERMYLSHFYTDVAYNPAAFTKEDIDEYVRTYSAPGAMRAGFEYYRAFPEDARQNREYAQRKLQMPVLALGAASGTSDIPLRQLQEVAENVRGDVIERCGHWLSTECPAEVAQRLLPFLNEN